MPAPSPPENSSAKPPARPASGPSKSVRGPSAPPERLQKWLAGAGVGSRRTCETWIQEGRVRVNGEVITELGTKIQPDTDKVTFDGRLVRPPSKRYYIALNKPRGYVSSRSDVHAARLVTELVDLPSNPLLRPVGRLDAESEGLLFLTDDGDFLYKMTHPKHHIPKTYRAEVRGVPNAEAVRQLRQGVMLEDGLAAGAEGVNVWPIRNSVASRLASREDSAEAIPADDSRAQVELTIFEGRNRQVRRMLAAVGHPVVRLTRVRIGDVRLTGLAPGAWRHLTPNEVAALNAAPAQQHTQENKTWHAPSHSRPHKAPSSPNSPKPTPPARPRTSSNSPKRGSTTD